MVLPTLITTALTIPADTITPVGLYLTVRDAFPGAHLLESGDYRGAVNSTSFICAKPLAVFKAQGSTISVVGPAMDEQRTTVDAKSDVLLRFEAFRNGIRTADEPSAGQNLFGYISHRAIEYFEQIELTSLEEPGSEIPDLLFALFEYVFRFDHYRQKLTLFHNRPEGRSPIDLSRFLKTLLAKPHNAYPFSLTGEEYTNFTDNEFCEVVERCKHHIRRGDVFQIVPSRRFSQTFTGDEFNVYRALRSINPSPYLFYFDFLDFKLFGSSPEAQILIENGSASILPIAGTYRRTGNETRDLELAEKLKGDPKENAEHVMLVDLARNDLSRHCRDVAVASFKEIQFYSHVIHLVSKVTGRLKNPEGFLRVIADTFPAGTLTGAPKYRAMELIDQFELGGRNFYGGCIGFLTPQGDATLAILIRTFLSKGNMLHRQAGAGIVADSDPQNELEEVNNKLMALKRALAEAEHFDQVS